MQDVAAMRHCKYGFLRVLPLFFLILIIAGCAPKARAPISNLHTPEHHALTGMKLLETGKLSDAEREFNLARSKQEEALAYVGFMRLYTRQKDEGWLGHVSPFADVRNDVPCFNAVMVCTTRGIIEPRRCVRQDIFDPGGAVSGADALLAIRRLNEDLGIF